MQNTPTHPHRRKVLATTAALLGAAATPWVIAQAPAHTDETWQNPRRQRAVPVRIRSPQSAAHAGGWPVVLYSYGLGGSHHHRLVACAFVGRCAGEGTLQRPQGLAAQDTWQPG